MKKKDRQIVFEKFGGRCAFCGTKLTQGCHIWDIEPIKTLVKEDGGLIETNTHQSNLLPACKSCVSVRHKQSIYKDKPMSIEQFRKDIIESFEFLKGGGITKSSYGRAIRFGLIKETGAEVKFYFEPLTHPHAS